jgi:UDP-glucuronate 4-epimerase
VYNIGNHQPVALLDFIATLEQALGREAVKQFKPMQPGDVEATYADTEALRRDVGFVPRTPLAEGLGGTGGTKAADPFDWRLSNKPGVIA